ncbi:MAG: hypothetical protein LUE65_08280 [Clostridiales bacterium]|nr:hypothetical protein [Clostridiales bacterium]
MMLTQAAADSPERLSAQKRFAPDCPDIFRWDGEEYRVDKDRLEEDDYGTIYGNRDELCGM